MTKLKSFTALKEYWELQEAAKVSKKELKKDGHPWHTIAGVPLKYIKIVTGGSKVNQNSLDVSDVNDFLKAIAK